MNHADHRPAARRQRMEHADVGKLVQEYDIGLKLCQRPVECVGGAAQRKAFGEDIAPFGFASAGAAAMRHADAMAPPPQLLRSKKDVCLGAPECADPFVNK